MPKPPACPARVGTCQSDYPSRLVKNLPSYAGTISSCGAEAPKLPSTLRGPSGAVFSLHPICVIPCAREDPMKPAQGTEQIGVKMYAKTSTAASKCFK